MKNISWVEYYKDKVNNKESEENFFIKYKEFLRLIVKTVSTFKKRINLVEMGCGIGTVSKLLINKFPEMSDRRFISTYLLTDVDDNMLDLANKNLSGNLLGDSVVYSKHDLTTGYIPDEYLLFSWAKDVVVTHGVLEHFNQSEIKEFINTLDDNINVLAHIHYVPTSDYVTKSYGDENLWAMSTWIKLVEPDIIMKNGPDLYLVKLKGINQL